jgi:hypothetical protein
MTLSGHDPEKGHLFVWDKEFKYAGRVKSPPGDSFSPDGKGGIFSPSWTDDCRIGAYFLGGVNRPAKVIWANGAVEAVSVAVSYRKDSGILLEGDSAVSIRDRVILCGPVSSSPAAVARFCRIYPANSMSVCALTDELPAFGCLARELCKKGLDRPRRANLFQPNTDNLPYQSREFDEKMEGDGYGRMAHAVSLGSVVHNDMMRGPGVSPFYGRLLSKSSEIDSTTFIINADCVEKFLSPAPVSFREVAKCVPVLCPVSDAFREAIQQQVPEAVVFVSGLVPGLDDFLRFYGAMTGRGVVLSCPVKLDGMKGTLPVFGYNRVYIPDADHYRYYLKISHEP